MAKRKFNIKRKRVVIPTSKRDQLIVIGLLVSLIAVGGVFARWRSRPATPKPLIGSKPEVQLEVPHR